MDSQQDNIAQLKNRILFYNSIFGKPDTELLDRLIRALGVSLHEYKDQETARDMWRKLAFISCIDPDAYKEILEKVQKRYNKVVKGNDIPDIPA